MAFTDSAGRRETYTYDSSNNRKKMRVGNKVTAYKYNKNDKLLRTDTHGNIVQLADETGNVIKNYEYDSFGNEVKPDSKDDNPFRYCGEYYDKETEEIYLLARYYQPERGRFLTNVI